MLRLSIIPDKHWVVSDREDTLTIWELDSGIEVGSFMKPEIYRVAVLLTAWLLVMPAAVHSTQNDDTDQAIRHLVNYVSGSGLVFVRNSSTYTSGEAAEHMNKKYQHFKADIRTAEDFIELCASKSILSGKPYLVIDRDGNKVRTSALYAD